MFLKQNSKIILNRPSINLYVFMKIIHMCAICYGNLILNSIYSSFIITTYYMNHLEWVIRYIVFIFEMAYRGKLQNNSVIDIKYYLQKLLITQICRIHTILTIQTLIQYT